MFLFLPFWLVSAASGQQPPAVLGTSPSEIHLDVVVTPKGGGAPLSELRREDFSVLDNGAAQPITSFKVISGDEVPTSVILVLDAVNTSYSQVAYERGEVAKFLGANSGQLAYPTTLAFFTDTGTKIQENFTRDGKALNDSLSNYTTGLRNLRRSTGFYGAEERVQLSINALHALVAQQANRPGRKIILWLSPQWPLLSGPGVDLSRKQQESLFSLVVELSTQLRHARVTLYSIDPLGVEEGLAHATYYQQFLQGVEKPKQTQMGNVSLQVLAVQSGGRALNSSGVAASLQRCVDDITSYYELSFTPPTSTVPNEYHRIKVNLTNPGLVAQYRQGYYANAALPEAR